MKLQAITILSMYDSLEKISAEELDLNTACIIAKNIKELFTVKDVIEKKRNKLITEFAKKDENGTIMQSDDGNIEITDPSSFSNKINKLLNSEIEVNIIPISKKSLSAIKITAKDILPIIEILEE